MIASRKELAQFVETLQSELEKRPEEWENFSLQSYLGALATYLEDIDGYYQNTGSAINPDQPSWQLFADALKGASIYE